ncbi:MAG: hypothetical protein ABIR32_05945 [Ilumatobacteraceae bacterium]
MTDVSRTADRSITGAWRSPAQMLDDQHYDGHLSVHDPDAAASLGLAGAPIEGPTHFSQFDPVAEQLWGRTWFERGCISAHFQTMVVAGEQVQATMTTTDNPFLARIEAHKRDGQSVLTGTASIGTGSADDAPTELDARRAKLGDPGDLFVVDQVEVGQRSSDGDVVTMIRAESNGNLYPFSLDQKLARITESHRWYTADGGAASPWGRAIVPFEMISVLAMKSGSSFPVRTPSLGLFLDLEIRLHGSPVFVDQPYVIGRQIVGLGQSRKTESYWISTMLTDQTTGALAATVVLHSGVFKGSYPGYPQDRLT